MTTHHDETYLALLHHVLKNGVEREDRTGIGTKSIFGYQMRFDLEKGFPLLTTKMVFFTGVVDELLWFLSGSTNVNDLPKRSRQLWAPWADDDGDLGFIYGYQWRSWTDKDDHGYRGLDQIAALIRSIKASPCSRRHIVSAWNPAEVGAAALPPCHVLFQHYVNDGKLSCQLYQRSADVFLGVPFNIASYALLTHMIAQVTGLKVGAFIHTLGDAHLYLNHLDQARLQLSREPFHSPQIMLNQAIRDIDDFKFADIVLTNYHPQPAIKAPVAV